MPGPESKIWLQAAWMLAFEILNPESADKSADKTKSVSAAAHKLHTAHIRAPHEVRLLPGHVGAALVVPS